MMRPLFQATRAGAGLEESQWTPPLSSAKPTPAIVASVARPGAKSGGERTFAAPSSNVGSDPTAAQTGACTSVTCNAIGASLTTASAGSGFPPGVRRPNPAVLKEFQRVCQLGHRRYCMMLVSALGPPPELSPRETEVLALGGPRQRAPR
jgi:hypothetical protein